MLGAPHCCNSEVLGLEPRASSALNTFLVHSGLIWNIPSPGCTSPESGRLGGGGEVHSLLPLLSLQPPPPTPAWRLLLLSSSISRLNPEGLGAERLGCRTRTGRLSGQRLLEKRCCGARPGAGNGRGRVITDSERAIAIMPGRAGAARFCLLTAALQLHWPLGWTSKWQRTAGS